MYNMYAHNNITESNAMTCNHYYISGVRENWIENWRDGEATEPCQHGEATECQFASGEWAAPTVFSKVIDDRVHSSRSLET